MIWWKKRFCKIYQSESCSSFGFRKEDYGVHHCKTLAQLTPDFVLTWATLFEISFTLLSYDKEKIVTETKLGHLWVMTSKPVEVWVPITELHYVG